MRGHEPERLAPAQSKGPDNSGASGIPSTLTSFVGPRTVIADTLAAIERGRMVTLAGPGGVGKTRVAVEVLQEYSKRYQDEVIFIDLSSASTAESVIAAIATAVRTRGRTGAPDVSQVIATLSSRDVLLVLDNCERVSREVGLIAREVLEHTSTLRLLVTSRHHLELTCEEIVPVVPLQFSPGSEQWAASTPLAFPAVQLFVQRARAKAPQLHFDDDDLRLISDLCRRLDGLPLAIELAAARARSMSIEQIHAHLVADEVFALLSRGDLTTSPRHHGLARVVEWSYELCTPLEQRVWSAIAHFAGPPELGAVIEILPERHSAIEVEEAIDGLASRSILSTEQLGGSLRFRMLQTTASFALQRASAEDLEVASARHSDYFVRRAQALHRGMWSGRQHENTTQMQLELPDFVRAWEQIKGDPSRSDDTYALALSLRPLWVLGGAMSTGRQWVAVALQNRTTDLVRGEALWTMAWMAQLQGDFQTATQSLRECRAIAERVHSASMGAFVDLWEATDSMFAGETAQARRLFESAISVHLVEHNYEGLLMAHFQLALTCALMGDYVEADRVCGKAISLSDDVEDDWCRAYAIWIRGFAALQTGHRREARELAATAIQLKAPLKDVLGMALVSEVMVSACDLPDAAAVGVGVLETLWQRAESRIEVFGDGLAAVSRASRAQLRNQIGVGDFERRVGEGRAMSAADGLEHIISMARQHQEVPPARRFTLRESQVAQLLAEGMANREIAERLTVSVRTAEGHVDNVLRKLGVASRAQAAAVLAREGDINT